MSTTITLLFTVISFSLIAVNVEAASLPVDCFDPMSSSAAEGCMQMMRMAKRSHAIAAAPEKKGYDYIRFGKRSGPSDDSHSAEFEPSYQFVERPRMPMATRNFVFKPFLV